MSKQQKPLSKEKLEAIEKYGVDGIYELKIRDTKTDPTLFHLINAIEKDVRAEACREILKRALTDIYFGLNETELVKQSDLIKYMSENSKAVAPTKQWLFTTDINVESPVINGNTLVLPNNTEELALDGTEDDYQDCSDYTEKVNDYQDDNKCLEDNNKEDSNEYTETYNEEDDDNEEEDVYIPDSLIGNDSESFDLDDDNPFF